MFLAEMDSGPGLFAGLVFVGLLLVGLVWLLFPFIVNSKMNELIREIRGLRKDMHSQVQLGNELLEQIAARTGRIAPPPVPPASPKDDGHRPPLQEEKPPEVYRID
jgi:hypothetical protein